MSKEKLEVIVQVNTKPVSVSYECPNCEEGIEINYDDFTNDVGDYCDWIYSKIKCPKCDSELEIDDSEWD